MKLCCKPTRTTPWVVRAAWRLAVSEGLRIHIYEFAGEKTDGRHMDNLTTFLLIPGSTSKYVSISPCAGKVHRVMRIWYLTVSFCFFVNSFVFSPRAEFSSPSTRQFSPNLLHSCTHDEGLGNGAIASYYTHSSIIMCTTLPFICNGHS